MAAPHVTSLHVLDLQATMTDTNEYEGKDINAEIQECRQQVEFWTNKLQKLEAIRRRPFLMARIKEDPLATWEELAEGTETKDVVLALINRDPHFFGECPWTQGEFDAVINEDRPILPDRLWDDRDVILAYAKVEDYKDVYGYAVDGTYGYDIPDCVADDKEVVLAMCGKHWPCLGTASQRLQDDKEVVLAAIRWGDWNSCLGIQHASERLRGDVDIILAAVKSTEYDFSWLGSFARFVDVESEKTVAVAVAKRLLTMDPESCYEEDLSPLPHFSKAVLDDEKIMLDFLNAYGYCLKWCSERLQSDAEVVKAAVKTDASAVEFARGKARKDLMSDCEFMTTAIRNDGGALLLHAPTIMQQDKSIVLEAVANGLAHRDVPRDFRSDPGIALEALKMPLVGFTDLDDSVVMSKSFALDVVKIKCSSFRYLPAELQSDEQIALQTLKSNKDSFGNSADLIQLVLEKVPSLLGSEEAMTIIVKTSNWDPKGLCGVLRSCPFVDNKEFILNACRQDYAFLDCASERLRSDRDVVLTAISQYHERELCRWRKFPLTCVPLDFQLANINIIVKVIKLLHVEDTGRFLGAVPAGVWSHRSVVLAWLERG